MIKRAAVSTAFGFICICFYVLGTLNSERQEINKEQSRASHSVMRLLGAAGGGTGFQVAHNGYRFIITNDHVCGLADSEGELLAVPTFGRVQKVHIIARSAKTDLCMLTSTDALPALLISGKDFKYGEPVTVIGHPNLNMLTKRRGQVGQYERISVLEYVINSDEDLAQCTGPKHHVEPIYFGILSGCIANIDSQRTSVPIKPGNSGSPALDNKGFVRGVFFAAASTPKGIPSFLIPAHDLFNFIEETLPPHEHKAHK